MPMDFPDMKSLIFAAKAHKFRMPEKDETEHDYRKALADFNPDKIEAHEIRTKKGWDKWTEKERSELWLLTAIDSRRNK